MERGHRIGHTQQPKESILRILGRSAHQINMKHIDDHDLERYHLGMVKDEAELAVLEGHLLWCGACVDRAEAAATYVDAVRAAACDLAE